MESSNRKNQLLGQLVNSGCLKRHPEGEFKLKAGITSKYYVNLREATMHPEMFRNIVLLIKELIPKESKSPVAVVGVPYGVVPVASAVAYECNLAYFPMRKEIKDYGYKQDGDAFSNFEFIMIEDVMSTGSSIIETLKNMEGKKVTDVIVIVDREFGGEAKLHEEYPEIRLHSMIKMSEIQQNPVELFAQIS